MRCQHGVVGPCVQCRGASVRAQLLVEVTDLVLELAVSAGLDTSAVKALLKRLK